jgi:hypothetical protein
MKHLFVPYELAVKLKEKGFDWNCIKFWVDGKLILALNTDIGNTNTQLSKLLEKYVAAPLYQQVTDWLISKNIYAHVSDFPMYNGKYGYRYGKGTSVEGFSIYSKLANRCDVLDFAMEEALKLIK